MKESIVRGPWSVVRSLLLGTVVFLFFLPTIDCLPPTVFADEIYFTSGETLRGLVVEEHHDRVVVSTEEGEKTVLRSRVEEIFYAEPERNYLYLGHQAIEDSEFSLARGFLQKVLQINPRLSEAEDALRRLEDLERKRATPLAPMGGPLQALGKALGITLKASEQYTRASGVREGSSAQRAGILPGDALVAAWRHSLAFLAPEEAAAELVGPSGTQIKLTIERVVELPKGSSSRGWPEGRGEASSSRSRWPQMDLEMGRLGVTVLRAQPAGAAEKAGLSPGDRIVRIFEESTRYMPLHQAQRKIAEARERGVRLVLHRDLLLSRE